MTYNVFGGTLNLAQSINCSLSHVLGQLVLAAAASECMVRISGTNSHRICEAQTPGNSLSVALRAAIRVCVR